MTESEFKAAQATMPWTERSIQAAKGKVLVQIVDNRGIEVPLFTMTKFIEFITAKLAVKQKKENDYAPKPMPDQAR